MTTRAELNLLQYGISNDLAAKAVSAGLTLSKARALAQSDMVNRFGLSESEAATLHQATRREPIDPETVAALLEHSNYVCCVCKGQKSPSYLIHHMNSYSSSQDNSYSNLVVLCPTCHDLAHQGGLTLRLTEEQLQVAKFKWERQVEAANAQRAAQRIEISGSAIDYVNIKRIEELCRSLFGEIPRTSMTDSLRRTRILDQSGSFDQAFVQRNLSNGRYLFDYMNSGETHHYRQLLVEIARVVDFIDLNEEAAHGYKRLKATEGRYASFVGGAWAKAPKLPITSETQPVVMRYTKRKIHFEWVLDPMFMMAASAIYRLGGKNRYVIYCLVQSVERIEDGVAVSASPLLIALPTLYADKTPIVAYERMYSEDDDPEEDA